MPTLSFRTGLLLFVLSAGYVVVGSLVDNQRFNQHFRAFNEADVTGPLAFVGPAYKGVAMAVQGRSDQRYICYPLADQQLNGDQSFLALARTGDYVQKKPQADTLILVKGPKRYRFLFKVPGTSFWLPYRLR